MSKSTNYAPRHAKAPLRRGLASSGVLSIALAGGVLGAANLNSAQGASALIYSCNTAVGTQDVSVTISSNAPASAKVGDTVSVSSVTGKLELPGSLGNAMAGFLSWQSVSGTSPNTVTITAPDNTTATNDIVLMVPKTTIYKGTWVNDGTYGGFGPDGHLVLPLNSTSLTKFTANSAGTYTISAPDKFTSSFQGTTASGGTGTTDSSCTYKSGNKVVASITVSAATPSTTSPAPTSSTTTASPAPTSTTPAPTSSTTTASPAPTSTTPAPTSSTGTPAPTTTTTGPVPTSTTTTGPVPISTTPAPTSTSTTPAPTSSTGTPAPTSTMPSSSSTTPMPPATDTPSGPVEGPKVETDGLQTSTHNWVAAALGLIGMAALGGSIALGRRK